MTYTIDVHVGPDHVMRSLRNDVATGLTREPKQLPPKWFYDDRGSQLFDAITRLPEYYLTSRESEILSARSAEIAALTEADTLVELGSGTSAKTRMLLDALARAGRLRLFVPFDVSEGVLREAAHSIGRAFPTVDVHAVAGDFDLHLQHLPKGGRRLVIFLGSTIGNLDPAARKAFFDEIAGDLDPGDHFLVGADLVKDVAILEAAYNDPSGVTEAFNKNVLSVINRELHADFDIDRFAHLAFFDADNSWIEMRLISQVAHPVAIPDLDLEIELAKDEYITTEISTKFVLEEISDEIAATGMTVRRAWTDERADFALLLAAR
ncbi:MAG TPA: L-histidine N(alpha)-methyltransferase [Actinomycetota bacterium]|nr:L-histidine N(alpha)-methyltransferase [Actinomycetota bacterium]